MDDIFVDRHEAFRFGYAAFHNGHITNFYLDDTSEEGFWKQREWQHGFDVAFLEAQGFWNTYFKPAA